MSLNLTFILISISIFLILLTTYFLRKGRIPEKYSLLWYCFALILLFVGVFPNAIAFISSKLGFQVMSNLVIGFIMGILILLTMALTIMIAGQKKKATLLIQEVSILKERLNQYEKEKRK